MSTDGVDTSRRRFLTAATSVVGAVGAGFVVVPFISSMEPSERAKAAGAPVEADFSKLEPGSMMTVAWRGKPVWILHRTKQNLVDLKTLDSQLRDPNSEVDHQPPYCKNEYRSRKPEYLIVVGICTHLGCSPTYRPEIAPPDLGPEWKGGYFCPCHGSRFDLAGRVYKGVPAPTNLVIMKYMYLNERRVLIGKDEGAA
ncbi:Ubiquinol-cytochrome C reductase iron-sulfur subunit [hydrothermal vent metagenome]|uniref:Ubiquinol-cytochrome c reductase iron-sulfur subunit n=1 Tax=hydrothermal vent metagenome TaxID=652676 RepID=A0A3B1B6Z9_9ZZZZ